jgi:hypothetical protein
VNSRPEDETLSVDDGDRDVASYFILSGDAQFELMQYINPVVSDSSQRHHCHAPFRGLSERIDSAVLIAMPTSAGGVYMAFSILRIDVNDRAVDQHPFGFFVHATGIASVGLFVHHGDWGGGGLHNRPANSGQESQRVGSTTTSIRSLLLVSLPAR